MATGGGSNVTENVLDTREGRHAWLDYAKGLGIILVVFGHANRSVGRTPDMTWSEPLRFADEVVYAFHMPLFFVLAGIAAGLSDGRPGSAWRSLVWGIAVPYLIWTVIWFGMKAALPSAVNHPLAISELSRALVIPVEHFWFLYHLLFARLFWLVAQVAGRLDDGRRGYVGPAIVVACFMAGSYLGGRPGLADQLGYFIGNVGFFGAGLLLSTKFSSGSDTVRPAVWDTLVLAAVFAFAFGLLRPGSVSAGMFIVAALGTAMMISFARLLPTPSGPGLRLLAFLGEASLAIYLVHLIVIAIVRTMLKFAGVPSEMGLVVLGTVFGVAVPAVLFILSLRAGAETGLPVTRWIGFGAARRSHYAPGGATSPVLSPSSS